MKEKRQKGIAAPFLTLPPFLFYEFALWVGFHSSVISMLHIFFLATTLQQSLSGNAGNDGVLQLFGFVPPAWWWRWDWF